MTKEWYVLFSNKGEMGRSTNRPHNKRIAIPFWCELDLDLEIEGNTKGWIQLKTVYGERLDIILSEFIDLIKRGLIVNGVISGRFTFTRRGEYPTLKYIGPKGDQKGNILEQVSHLDDYPLRWDI